MLSPLLANVYLHELDRYFHKRFVDRTPWEREKCRKHGGTNAGYIRYADDFVILCNGSIKAVRQLKADVAAFLEDELHLTLSAEKTAITHANKGFEFLGFRFYRGLDRGGKWKPKTAIPQSKIAAMKDKVKDLTGRERTYLDEAAVVTQLNAVLRGWGNYYRHVPASTTFREVDHYAFWRLVRWYVHKYHWTRPQVMKRRWTRDAGNRRLFAEWDGRQNARKRVNLVTLTRDIRFKEYFARQKGNPYLADTLVNEIPEWKAGCGESRTSGLEEGM